MCEEVQDEMINNITGRVSNSLAFIKIDLPQNYKLRIKKQMILKGFTGYG